MPTLVGTAGGVVMEDPAQGWAGGGCAAGGAGGWEGGGSHHRVSHFFFVAS